MRKVLALLKRVPVWVWLFIAVSSVATVAGQCHDLRDLNRSINQLGNEPAEIRIKFVWESMYWKGRRQVLTGLILGPVSTGLAYWKWSSTRPWARHFSLRTLLIATTLVAVILGLIVWQVGR